MHIPLTNMVSNIVFIFCVFFTVFINKSEAQCYGIPEEENEIREVGQVWTSENCSRIYTCKENSTYIYLECPVRSKDDVLNILEINSTDLTMMILSCCIQSTFLSTSALDEFTEVMIETDESATDSSCCTTDIVMTTMTSYDNSSQSACLANNRTFEVGEEYNLPNKCFYNKCEGDNLWIRKGCGLFVVPEGWTLTPMNTSKTYPECCEGLVPDLDIVPDILDSMPYVEFLNVTYENNLTVDKGRELTPIQVKSEPTIDFTSDPEAFYTLCMVDPDAPSRKEPTFREILHWLVVNIPGSNVSKGEVLAGYRGSGAPKGSGLHRYVFFLYKQPGKLTFDEPQVSSTSRKHRLNFSLKKFAKKYSLGDPVAFNVFQAQWDEYVPVLQQLTDPE